MLDAFLLWGGWNVATGVAAFVGLFACVLFVVRFHVETGGAWWRHPDGSPNPFGRFLFFRKLLLAVLFAVLLANRLTPGWIWRDFVVAVLMSAFAVQTFVPYRLLLTAQKEMHRSEAR